MPFYWIGDDGTAEENQGNPEHHQESDQFHAHPDNMPSPPGDKSNQPSPSQQNFYTAHNDQATVVSSPSQDTHSFDTFVRYNRWIVAFANIYLILIALYPLMLAPLSYSIYRCIVYSYIYELVLSLVGRILTLANVLRLILQCSRILYTYGMTLCLNNY